MSDTVRRPVARMLAPALGLAFIAAGLAACGDSGLLGRGILTNPFQGPERLLPGERRPAIPQAEGSLAVDEQAAATPVQISGESGLSDWSQPGGVPSNNPGNVALSGGSGWSVGGGRSRDDERLTISPISYQGQAIVMDGQGTLAAYSLSGGGRAWSTNLRPQGESGRAMRGGIAASGGILVAATPFSTLVGVDPRSGGQLWTIRLGAPPRSAPTIADGTAYVVTADNVLHAVDVSEGSERWTYTGIGETAGVLGNASPAVSGSTVIVPYSSGEIVAVDAVSGEPQWFDVLTGASRFTLVSGLNDVVGRPVVHDGVVYAVSVSGRMIATRLRDGERLWSQSVASNHTPVVAGNTIFLTTLSGQVVALDRQNGRVRWHTDLAEGARLSLAGPLLAGSRLWIGTSDGRVLVLDPRSGSVQSSQSVGSPVFIAPIAARGRVLVLDNGGRLTALN